MSHAPNNADKLVGQPADHIRSAATILDTWIDAKGDTNGDVDPSEDMPRNGYPVREPYSMTPNLITNLVARNPELRPNRTWEGPWLFKKLAWP